jgi:hypothetical protein
MSIVIKPRGGLCNKLRFLLSYYNYAKNLNKDLIAIWEKDQYCPGYFLDYFKPIDGITFKQNNNEKLKIDFMGWDWLQEHTKENRREYCKSLVLIPEIQNAVSEYINAMENNYIAIHVRRTDLDVKVKQNNNYTDDEIFFNFIETHPDKKVFLATDNKETQQLFTSRYGDRLFFCKEIKDSDDLRKTSIVDAIIDLYICKEATEFNGTKGSSFSGFIDYLRK